MGSNGYSHPSILEHVGDIVERFGVREVIGQAITVDGDVDGVDRRPRGDMGGEGGMSSIPGFIGFIIPSRIDSNRSLRRRGRRRGLRDRRIRSKHKMDLFIGSGETDDRGGRGVRIIG